MVGTCLPQAPAQPAAVEPVSWQHPHPEKRGSPLKFGFPLAHLDFFEGIPSPDPGLIHSILPVGKADEKYAPYHCPLNFLMPSTPSGPINLCLEYQLLLHFRSCQTLGLNQKHLASARVSPVNSHQALAPTLDESIHRPERRSEDLEPVSQAEKD